MTTTESYRITVKGLIDPSWSGWFDGLTIAHDAERGETILFGPIRDQAALHGVLNKVRDLGLSLISVSRIQSDSQNISKEEMT